MKIKIACALLSVVFAFGFAAEIAKAETAVIDGVEVIIFEAVPPAPTPTPIPAPPTPTPKIVRYKHDITEVEALARWFYGSCYKTGDLEGKRQGAWHLWNRVIDDSGLFENSIKGVIEQGTEYRFYDKHAELTAENLTLATEMLNRFQMEANGMQGGRTLPVGYVYQIVNEAHDGYYYTEQKGGLPY